MSKKGSLLRLAKSISVCFVISAIVLPVCPLTVRFARSCSTLLIVFYVCLLALMVARVVIDIKNDREVKNMTLELFEAKLKKAKASRSGIAFIGLLKRNAVFIKENEAAVQEIFARVFPKDMVDGRTQPEEVVALDPSTGEVSQLSIDDLADKLD